MKLLNPTVEFAFQFAGFGNCRSECGVRIYARGDKPPVCVLVERGVGTSITNFAEGLAQLLAARVLACAPGPHAIGDIVWVEQWPDSPGDPEHFDRVIMDVRETLAGVRFHNPRWQRLGNPQMLHLDLI